MAAWILTFVVALGGFGAVGVADAAAQTPVAAPGQAPSPKGTSAAPAPQSGVTPADYLVGPLDVLKITVFGESQLSGLVRVDSDGTIPFQYLQRVKVEGLTPNQVAETLRKGLADGYFRNPQVSVDVDQYHSQNVYVMGEVKAPGKYSLPGDSTLVDVLTQAGSTTPTAGHWVLIFHRKKGSTLVGPANTDDEPDIKVSLADIQSGKAQNITIQDLDAISVPKAERIFVNGNVRTPGAFPYDEGMTVFEAIGIAGGVSEKGSNSRISIKRMIDGKLKDIEVKPTDLLKPGDQVFVKARRL
jgi:polysaccharide export outer membrane protein